jgi:hypothetical protein
MALPARQIAEDFSGNYGETWLLDVAASCELVSTTTYFSALLVTAPRRVDRLYEGPEVFICFRPEQVFYFPHR